MESIYNLYKYFMQYIINTQDESNNLLDNEYTIKMDLPKDISIEPTKQSEDIIKSIPIINHS